MTTSPYFECHLTCSLLIALHHVSPANYTYDYYNLRNVIFTINSLALCRILCSQLCLVNTSISVYIYIYIHTHTHTHTRVYVSLRTDEARVILVRSSKCILS